MDGLHKLSEWRPDLPERITGLNTKELEVIDRVLREASKWDPYPENRQATEVWDKIHAELARRKNGTN